MGDDVTTLRRVPGLLPYWSAATVSSFGSAVSAVAVPVLVVTVLHAGPFELGLVNAAQFLPYAVFGLALTVLTGDSSALLAFAREDSTGHEGDRER